MSAGSDFHTVGAATRKLRTPKLSLCDGTHNKLDWLERKLRPGIFRATVRWQHRHTLRVLAGVCLTVTIWRRCEFHCSFMVVLTQARLDFANLVLLGTSSSNINQLQRIQNCLARVVLLDHSSPAISLLSQLHWLPVPKRIEFKIATLTYQSVTLGQPAYFSALLTPYQPYRSLRSVSQIC